MLLYRDITNTKILGKPAPVWAESTLPLAASTLDVNPNTNVWVVSVGQTPGLTYRSTDDGLTWTSVNANLLQTVPSDFVECVKCNPTTGTWLILTRNGNVSRSVDDGATWTYNTSHPRLAHLESDGYRFRSNSAMAVSYSDGVWLAVTAGVQTDPTKQGYIAGSFNNGLTWQFVYSEAYPSNTLYGSIGVNQNTKRWLVASPGNITTDVIGVVKYSNNNGSSWTQVPNLSGGNFNGLSVSSWNNTWISAFGFGDAGGGAPVSNGIYRSTDDAVTWNLVPSLTAFSSVTNDNGVTWVIFGSSTNTGVISVDKGATFQSMDFPLNYANVTALASNYRTGVYITTATTGVILSLRGKTYT